MRLQSAEPHEGNEGPTHQWGHPGKGSRPGPEHGCGWREDGDQCHGQLGEKRELTFLLPLVAASWDILKVGGGMVFEQNWDISPASVTYHLHDLGTYLCAPWITTIF